MVIRVQNNTKKHNKRQKRTHMQAAELKQIRLEMNFEPRDMRHALALPGTKPIPRRTYQDYEAGRRGMSAYMAARIRELHKADREFMNGIGNRVDAAERGEKL